LPWPWEERHGRCMASVNQTRPYCVNQMGKTHSKPLAARHGRGTAWARHGHGMGTVWARHAMYESDLHELKASNITCRMNRECGDETRDLSSECLLLPSVHNYVYHNSTCTPMWNCGYGDDVPDTDPDLRRASRASEGGSNMGVMSHNTCRFSDPTEEIRR